jgi:cytochrome P450
MAVNTTPTISYPSSFEHLSDYDEACRVIAAARCQSPIAIGSSGPELLTYELVRTVLRDPRFVTALGVGLDLQGVTSGPLRDRMVTNILNLNGGAHDRIRRLVSKAFAPRGAERIRSLAVELITELVDPLIHVGRCDVVSDIARPYPPPIVCTLLGIPPADWPLITAWGDNMTKQFDGNLVEDGPSILAAWDQLDAYIEDVIASRRESLTGDVISDLIRAEDADDRLTHDELLALAAILLGAGTETTRNQLAAAIQVLADHPDQWALVAQHPELAANAVNELMRYCSTVFATPRMSIENVELGGFSIPAGTMVLANIGAANRDPAVYRDPELLDITRENAPSMLALGGGAHYCLGAHVARVELTEALRVITARMPNPHPTEPAVWKAVPGIIDPISVPLEFDLCG